jgi:3-oxoacyl-(acyl-carrier-protein) synthase
MSAIPIIGLGAVSSAGIGVNAGFLAVSSGDDLLSPLSLFNCGLKEPPQCAQITADITKILGFTTPNKTIGMAMIAAREATAPIKERKGLRLGIVGATTVSGMTRSELFYQEYLKDPSIINKAPSELAAHEPAAFTGFLGQKISADGIHTVSTACSSGLHAIGMAKRLIEAGEYDLCLAIGSDALSILTIRGFASLLLLDSHGCRPFDKNRAGISLGEGAGAMLLASSKAVDILKVSPIAYVMGWGASADCHHMTAPHPEGAGAKAAVAAAIKESNIKPADIDYIAAHGTGTPDNDFSEIAAMKSLFNPVPPFCSMKRTLGHTLAAAGILEAVFAVKSLSENMIPKSGGFGEVDDKIGLSPSIGYKKEIKTVLKNSFGFGGNNAAVVFSKIG